MAFLNYDISQIVSSLNFQIEAVLKLRQVSNYSRSQIMAAFKLCQLSNYGGFQIMSSLELWQFFNFGSSQIMAAVNCLQLLILIYFDFTEIVEEEEAAPVEEGYNYPVPANPLELPEKSSHSELPDDAVAPLALYGAPAQPFELPPGKLTRLSSPLKKSILFSTQMEVT